MRLLVLLLAACGTFGLETGKDGSRSDEPGPVTSNTAADDTAREDTSQPEDTDTTAPPDPDDDGDGAPASTDCDDTDPGRFPGNAEACDGVDNDCSGAAESDGDGACGLWTLGETDTRWEAHSLDPTASVHAPTATIEAAFASSDTGKVWVLTRYTYHVMVASTLEWITSGDRDELFPAVSGDAISVAVSVPASWPTDDGVGDVYLFIGNTATIYSYTPATNAFAYGQSVALGADWSAAEAPEADQLVAGWLATDEDSGWARPGNPYATCGADSATLGAYVAFLTAGADVYLYDAMYCFEFVSDQPAEDFSVFNLSGAPDPGVIAAIDWTGAALIAFAE